MRRQSSSVSPCRTAGRVPGRPLFNAAALLRDGKILETIGKTYLSSSGTLDENRYFEPASGAPRILCLGRRKIGISIGEEIWCGGRSPGELVRAGAEVIVNISASPFAIERQGLREKALSRTARDHRIPIAAANLVGGNDELVFDGRALSSAPMERSSPGSGLRRRYHDRRSRPSRAAGGRSRRSHT